MKKIKFYDTSSLLKTRKIQEEEPFLISSITLQELENIKNSSRKDEYIKYKARETLQFLWNNKDKYDVIIHKIENEKLIHENFEINNDIKILSDAVYYDTYIRPDETVFVTDDLALSAIANLYFGEDMIEKAEEQEDEYCGFIEKIMTEEEMASFYQNFNCNSFNLLENQYLIIRNTLNEVVACYKWVHNSYEEIKNTDFSNDFLGKVKPAKDDIYQRIACDALASNQITMLRGKAGSGKSFLSLGYLFYLLDKKQIDKIIIFCNPVATINSAKLGYYPGSRNEKLLDSQIGNFLASKLGDVIGIEYLIQQNKLVLLPFSDIRGVDTSGSKAGIYITEAQNLDITLMKLALQRIGSDCVCVIEGDDKSQVDDIHFEGINNGMKRLSKVFRGNNIYGETELKIIHRSVIAAIADNM